MTARLDVLKRKDLRSLANKTSAHLRENKSRFFETYKVHEKHRDEAVILFDKWKAEGSKQMPTELVLKMTYYAVMGGMKP